MPRLRSAAAACAALILLVFTPAAAPGQPAPAAPAAPAAAIEDLHAALLTGLKTTPPGKAGIQARYQQFEPVMRRIYDFPRMIEVATGTAWAGASEAERAALADAFARLSVMIYAQRFGAGYSGERFEITGERSGPRDTRYVDTLIHRGTAEPLKPGEDPAVKVTYVLAERGGGWRIIDVLLDQSISELALRRSEYATVLRQGGVPQLIKVLNDKAEATAAG